MERQYSAGGVNRKEKPHLRARRKGASSRANDEKSAKNKSNSARKQQDGSFVKISK
jgi:hypothetical protein